MKKTHIKEYTKRCLILLLGLCLIAFGIAFSIKANLGTSPVSSLPYVLSLILPVSVGTTTIVLQCALIIVQILILRKNFNPVQLLQLPVALIFGSVTDIAVKALSFVHASSYLGQWGLCAVGILLVALGVSVEVSAKTITLSAEGASLAISSVTGVKFGTVKIFLDVAMVAIAFALSLIFLGTLKGVREGTVVAAVLVGTIVKQLNKFTVPMAERIIG